MTSLKLIKSITEQTHFIFCLCVDSKGNILSCSDKYAFKIYNLNENMKFEIAIEGRTTNYMTLLSEQAIITCSDEVINLWNKDEYLYECIAEIKGHKGYINQLELIDNKYIASCSRDNTIKLWSIFSPYECIFTLEHNDKVTSMLYIKKIHYLISYSEDNTLTWWNLNIYDIECFYEDIQCTDSPNIFASLNDNIFILGGEYKIYIFNAFTQQIVNIIQEQKFDYIYSVCNYGHKVIIGTTIGDLYEMDIFTYENKIIKKQAHQGWVNSIAVYKDYIISCGYDEIKVWKYNTKNN